MTCRFKNDKNRATNKERKTDRNSKECRSLLLRNKKKLKCYENSFCLASKGAQKLLETDKGRSWRANVILEPEERFLRLNSCGTDD